MPGELSHNERNIVSDVVREYDSDFRVKAGSVADVSLVTPEAGVIVLNELDGLLYFADQYGWNQGGRKSPIQLFVKYTDTQFAFRFMAPIGKTLDIYDGDGTMTQKAGNDSTPVTHNTTYAEAGTYTFYVLGDVLDITWIRLNNQSMISGSINGYSLLLNLVDLLASSTGLYGNISNLNNLPLSSIILSNSDVTGSVEDLVSLVSLVSLTIPGTDVVGDVSAVMGGMTLLQYYYAETTDVEFNSVITISSAISVFSSHDCNWTTTMVDNCLISLANGTVTGATITLGGNNAPRSPASDAAFAQLDAANTLTVN